MLSSPVQVVPGLGTIQDAILNTPSQLRSDMFYYKSNQDIKNAIDSVHASQAMKWGLIALTVVGVFILIKKVKR